MDIIKDSLKIFFFNSPKQSSQCLTKCTKICLRTKRSNREYKTREQKQAISSCINYTLETVQKFLHYLQLKNCFINMVDIL